MTQSPETSMTFKFIWRNFIVASVLFVTALLIGNLIVNITCASVIEFDCPLTWPISIFSIRPTTPLDLFIMIGLLGILYAGARFLRGREFPILPVLGLAIVLIVGSTSIAGWTVGYEVPINYGEEIYYQDVLRMDDPITLIRNYEDLQQTFLYKHARTNPPGALLNIYLLNILVNDPAIISLIVLVMTTAINGYFLYTIVRRVFPDESGLAGYATLLFLCIPAVQVYYTHGVDPIVATTLLGTIIFIISPNCYAVVGAVICLFWATFTSFLSIFIIPVLVGLALLHNEYRTRIAIVATTALLLHIGMLLVLNYNYTNSLLIASAFENPDGLRLFSDTATYISTRFESIAEILLFFSPFLVMFLIRGIPIMRRERSILLTLSGFALLSFLGMMLMGTMSTGEAARAMVFVYPYLLFPMIYVVRDLPQYRVLLVCLVYGQTLLMQTIGIYFA